MCTRVYSRDEMRGCRLALAVATVGAAALIAASPASAKENVKATLVTAIPLDAPAGTQLSVTWRLFYVNENGRRRPFGANGVFVRLLSASGAAAKEGVAPVGAYEEGEYEATVVVPEGGIRDIQIGLVGWVNGTVRSDVLFPITNDPVPTPAPITPSAPQRPVPSGSGTSSAWMFVLVSTFSASALMAALLVRRSRRRKTAGPGDRASQPVAAPRLPPDIANPS